MLFVNLDHLIGDINQLAFMEDLVINHLLLVDRLPKTPSIKSVVY